jgi:hypothetical protein
MDGDADRQIYDLRLMVAAVARKALTDTAGAITY